MQEYDNTNTEADNKKGYEKHGQSFWDKELVAANKRVKKFHSKGGAIVDRYIGKGRTDDILKTSRLNLFHSNIKTLQSMLYGNLPKVDVSRRYADGTDDAARVAAEIFERLLVESEDPYIRNRTWFYLGKVRYHQSAPERLPTQGHRM